MAFNSSVVNPGRLSILTALAVEDQQDFVTLRERTHLTDGNLSTHAKRLAEVGMVAIEKKIDAGKPVTRFTLTVEGRTALEGHVRKLLAALSQRRVKTSSAANEVVAVEHPRVHSGDEWVD